MGRSDLHITAAELEILKILWQLGSATVRETLAAIAETTDPPPAYTTVMTMMKQLADKGALRVDRDRQPYVYTPAVRREQVVGQRVRQLLQSVFDGQASDLVLHLVEQADLSPEDLRRIEDKIRQRERDEKPRRRRSPRNKG
jgi:predicted transcriptional regulator